MNLKFYNQPVFINSTISFLTAVFIFPKEEYEDAPRGAGLYYYEFKCINIIEFI